MHGLFCSTNSCTSTHATAVLGNLATANRQALTSNLQLGMRTNNLNTKFVLLTRACADMHVLSVAAAKLLITKSSWQTEHAQKLLLIV